MDVKTIDTYKLQEFDKYDKENPDNLKPSLLTLDDQELLFQSILKMLVEGKSYKAISIELNIRLSTLYNFTSKTLGYIERARHALLQSATTHAELSIQVLIDAPADKFELMRARELSLAHRWLASRKAPHIYGERVDVTSGGEKIVMLSLGSGTKPPDNAQDTDYIDVTPEQDQLNQ